MQLQGKAVRVVIYIGESDRFHGKSLYRALLELLRREGASGATVTRGLAGFGARSRIHTATILTLSEDLPIRLEWVDQPETVERLLPQVRQMVDDGLITVEEIEVAQYAPGRRPDPLAQPVRDIMRTEVVKVQPDTPVRDIVTLLLQRGYHSLPVVDQENRLVGIITDGDLIRRADLSVRLDLQADLPEEQLKRQLTSLWERTEIAAEIMTHPVKTMSVEDSLRVAMATMVTRGLKRLPVVDDGARLVGWISRVDVLRNLEYHQQPLARAPVGTRAGATVSELMYTDVATVGPSARLEDIIQALEVAQYRRAIVIDGEERVIGILTDGDLIRRSLYGQHPGLLGRLRSLITGKPVVPLDRLPDQSETAAALMTTPVITITTQTSVSEALQLMMQHKIKRLPVVDPHGRLVGLLGRGRLLQGLL